MGGSSKQVTGYRYFANFLLFIGNPIEKLLAINFDKRGWIIPLLDENGDAKEYGVIDKSSIYGENEGGVAGKIHARYGTSNQEPVQFYSDYLAANDLPALAYPYQSYLAFTGLDFNPDESIFDIQNRLSGGGFYLGNSGYMKEMLLWPKRIHVRNDGRGQWYDLKSEIGLQWFEDKTIELKQHYLDTAGDFFTKYETNRRFSSSGGVFTNSNPPSRVLGGSFGYQGSETYGLSSDVGWPIKSDGETIATYSPNYSEGFSFKVEILSVGRTTIKNISAGYSYFVILDAWDVDTSGYGYHTNGYLIECFVYPGESISLKLNTEFLDEVTTTHHAIQIIPREPRLGIIHKGSASGTDINPIHKIREILTDDTAMNKPESSVNNENFMMAADRIWDEGLGISWSITEKACIDAINELCYHIEAGIRVNRQTGLYEMVLFRDDWFEEDEIHTIAESKIKSISFEIQNADEIINQLNVSFYDRDNIKNASFSIYENASIKNMQGRVNAESVDFPYFMRQRNAAVVAQWKLKQMTSPCWKGSFSTGYAQARKWNRYDLIKLNWSRKGITDLVVRIMSIDLGNGINNAVNIDFIEVVSFSENISSTVVIDDKIDTSPIPPQPALFKSFELSYFESVQKYGQRTVDDALAYNPDSGYVAVIATKPQNNSLNAQMHTDSGSGYENSAIINYCEAAISDQNINKVDSSFIIKNVGNLPSVRVGSQIFINNEIMVFESFDQITKLLTVKRGALDSIPQNHSIGSVLFFADDFISIDETEYAYGESIDVKVLTTTPGGILSLSSSDTETVVINSRGIRPYPPANVKINDEYFPSEIENDLVISWVNRNRIQQTGGDILGWYDGNVSIEPNTSTHLTLIEYDPSQNEIATNNVNVTGSSSYTMPISSMQPETRFIEIRLNTVRDGYNCLNTFVHTVGLSRFFSAPYDLTVEFKND